jgi:hypothetical protein
MTIARTRLAALPVVCHYCRGALLASHRHVLAAQERAVFFRRETGLGPAKPRRSLARDDGGTGAFSPKSELARSLWSASARPGQVGL